MEKVGEFIQQYNDLLGTAFPCGEIFRSDGLFSHINKRHPDCAKHYQDIGDIIRNPDYIGASDDGVEFIKKIDEYLLVAVKIDSKDGYLYVATLYELTEGKVLRRTSSGKYKKV
ncbi:MAG: hypothetical protein IIU73_05320 [Selenomonadales bacterium]|nr:hypothetical protein [Selenomonadales bacterium]